MADMNIFRHPTFGMGEMTAKINRRPYIPKLIGSMGLFPVTRLRSKMFFLEENERGFRILQTDQRGEPIRTSQEGVKRKVRSFETPRITDSATITAEEVNGWRAWGSMTELMTVDEEIQRKMDPQYGVIGNFNATWERQKLGAVQGIVYDADGSELYNWFSEFGISQPAQIAFDLSNASPAPGALRKKCSQVIRAISTAAEDLWMDGEQGSASGVYALVGKNFYDDLTSHQEVRASYLNWTAAADLRATVGRPYQAFQWGDIYWKEFRGSKNGKIAIGDDEAIFFPINAPGVFACAFSPAEFFGMVNQPGMELYTRPVLDPSANGNFDLASWIRYELYSYPIYVCQRPEVLQRAKRGA